MREDQTMAIIQQQKKKDKSVNDNKFSYGLGYDARLDDDKESEVIAKTVDHCLSKGIMATFKDLDKITALAKSSILSSSNHVVIYNSFGNFVVQRSINDERNPEKINTTKILVGKNNRIEGESKTYIMTKDQSGGDNYLEKELSSCEITDINSFSTEGATNDEIRLYQKMKICQSLLGSVVNELGKKKNSNRSSDLNKMFTNQNEISNDKIIDTNRKK